METLNINVGNGINNKARSESMPDGFARSAINVDIDNAGNLRLRPGRTSSYTGTGIHSYWQRTPLSDRYFVEEGTLKRLELDNTATTIKTGVGDGKVSFSYIAGRIYYSNDIVYGSIINGNYTAWGIDRPSFQPTGTARTSGGMHGGDYQFAITWLREGEESGTINGNRITVADGGGLTLTNYPTPPSDVDGIAVYVTSVNGEDFWLYGEYPANVDNVSIDKHISTVPLMTQHGDKPLAFKIITAHYGRMYGAKGRHVYYSNARNYGLFKPRQYWTFPSDVTGIISVPGALYVGTKDKIYRISNIDGEGPEVRTEVREVGMVEILNPPEDIDNEIVYAASTKGFIAFTNEGVTDITAKNLAVDEYKSVEMTLIESDGLKKLIGVFQGIEKVSTLKASV